MIKSNDIRITQRPIAGLDDSAWSIFYLTQSEADSLELDVDVLNTNYRARISYIGRDGDAYYAFVYRDNDNNLYKLIPYPRRFLDDYGNFIATPDSPPPKVKPGRPYAVGTIGSTPHSTVTKYQVKVLVSNKHGYVEVKNPAKQGGSFMLGNLVYINKTPAADINSLIDFPPRFNGDLLWLEGKDFYSPNEDSYYYCAGAPDVKVSCYYRVDLEKTTRQMRANDCGYLVITQTAKYLHDELYTVAGFHIDFRKILIFNSTEANYPDVVFEGDDVTNIDTIPPPTPPPPAIREKFKIGPFEFLLPIPNGLGRDDLGPNDAEYDKLVGNEYEYARAKSLWIKTHQRGLPTSINLVPKCSKVAHGNWTEGRDIPSVYDPVNVYQGRHFYFPGNDTFYIYTGKLEPAGNDEKGDYYDVTYNHYPKRGEYAQTELVASGFYLDAQTFDQMILNS